MINLVKAEFLKLKGRNRIIPFLITCIVLSLIMFVVLITDKEKLINNWFDVFSLIITVTNLIVGIFIALLTSTLFASEYKDKTINTALTYPISRKKIYFSKIIVTFIYAFLFTLINIVMFFISYDIIIYIRNLTFITPAIQDSFSINIIPRILIFFATSVICETLFAIIYSLFCIVIKSNLLLIISALLCIDFSTKGNLLNIKSFLIADVLIFLIAIIILPFVLNYFNTKDVIC